MKRFLDIVLSLGALIFFSPLLLLIAFMVWIDVGTPVLFRQRRPGYCGRPFEMIKFRTMKNALDKLGIPLADTERITRLGKMLRLSSLDELPELWNVLKGDMSLVGPRPLLMDYLPYYTKKERKRHSVRPGITGYSQIIGRNKLSWDRRLAGDIFYVNNIGLMLDAKIILHSIFKVFMRSDVVVDPRSKMQDLNVERSGSIDLREVREDELLMSGNLIQHSLDLDFFVGTPVAAKRFPLFFSEKISKKTITTGVFRGSKLLGVINYLPKENSVHLNYFAVISEERGYGISRLMIQALIRGSEGKTITLHVDSRNERAISFYTKSGFLVVKSTEMCLVKTNGKISLSKVNVLDRDQFDLYGISYVSILGEKVGYIDGFCFNLDHPVSSSVVDTCLSFENGAFVRMPIKLLPQLTVNPKEEFKIIHMEFSKQK